MSISRLTNARRVSATSVSAARGSYFHVEALDWQSRVISNSGNVSASTLQAVSAFCRSIDAAGIRSKFRRLNLFCGTGLAAALVPLYRSASFGGTTYGNTTDTNNNFVSGDYNETGTSSGLSGNGTNKYLNTGIKTTSLAASDLHLGAGIRSVSNSSGYVTAVGSYDGGNGDIYQLGVRRADALRFCYFGNYTTQVGNFGEAVTPAVIAVGDIVAAWPTQYRFVAAVGTNGSTAANYRNSHDIYVMAINNGAGSGAAADLANARINWYSIGLTMTASEVTSLISAVVSFNIALSRT